MRVTDVDLLAGALARAYRYADLRALREAYVGVAAGEGSLIAALAEGGLEAAWVEKLERVTQLVELLRRDAVFGMIALENQLVGGTMLNACMEQGKLEGCRRPLGELLAEKGVLDQAQVERVAFRTKEVLESLLSRERQLAEAVDLASEVRETAELELAMVLGEVAAKLSFLGKDDLERLLSRRERLERGLPADELAPQSAQAEPSPPPAFATPQAPPSPPQHAAAQAPAPPPAAAQASPPPPQEEDPIKGFELLEKLGEGAMGAVVRALRRDTGEVVALKILKPELSTDPEYVARFLREAKAAARLSHPNIIRAVQSGRSGEDDYFAMEFVEGRTLSELVKEKGQLPERLAAMVTRCVASALAHAWEHQIVHRDIKPDNMMLTNDGQVKLTDLGLARNAKQDSTLTITGVVMGSPAYISPEQATGDKNLDTRSDIYSLGAGLYHLLTGKVPYHADTPLHVMLRHMNDPVPDVKTEAPHVSEATRQLIMRMMAKRADDRFSTGAEVAAAAGAIEDALARGQAPPINFATLEQLARNEAPTLVDAGTPQASAPLPSQSSKGHRPGASGKAGGDKPITRPGGVKRGKSSGKEKEVGERLRRLAAKRKRRY